MRNLIPLVYYCYQIIILVCPIDLFIRLGFLVSFIYYFDRIKVIFPYKFSKPRYLISYIYYWNQIISLVFENHYPNKAGNFINFMYATNQIIILVCGPHLDATKNLVGRLYYFDQLINLLAPAYYSVDAQMGKIICLTYYLNQVTTHA